MVVRVHAALRRGEALAAVIGDNQPKIGFEQAVGIIRVDDEIGEIEGAPDHHLAAVALGPGLAAVIGPEEGAAGVFDERVDAVGV